LSGESAERMRGFLISGITEEDEELVRRSAEYLGPLLPGLLDELYDHLLSLPETAGLLRGAGHRAPQGGAGGLGGAHHRGAARREVLKSGGAPDGVAIGKSDRRAACQ
jgi:hypothetical protein